MSGIKRQIEDGRVDNAIRIKNNFPFFFLKILRFLNSIFFNGIFTIFYIKISDLIDWIQATIEKRVNWLWVSEPNIFSSKAADEYHIIVELAWIKDIEKAILNADLGFNPMNDGVAIKVPVPALNEERRKEIIEQIRQLLNELKELNQMIEKLKLIEYLHRK